LKVAFVGFALIVCFARGPREKGWIGWSGGWAIKRDDLPPKKKDEEELPTTEALEEAPEEAAAVDGGRDVTTNDNTNAGGQRPAQR